MMKENDTAYMQLDDRKDIEELHQKLRVYQNHEWMLDTEGHKLVEELHSIEYEIEKIKHKKKPFFKRLFSFPRLNFETNRRYDWYTLKDYDPSSMVAYDVLKAVESLMGNKESNEKFIYTAKIYNYFDQIDYLVWKHRERKKQIEELKKELKELTN